MIRSDGERSPAAENRAGRARGFALQLALLSSYALVAIIYTFPLIRHLRAAFPSDGTDVFGFIWNNWWIHYAATELHTNPYFTDFIFVPFPVDLRLHTFGFFYGLLSIPFMSLLNPVGVLNAQILATIVLNGYSTYKLSAHVTKSASAGFVSGLIVASTPAINFHLTVGRPSCAALWPAILGMLAFLRLVERPDVWRSFWLAVSLIATILGDQQSALFCASWLIVLFGCLVVSRRRAVMNLHVVLAAGAVIAVLVVPAYELFWKPFTQTAGYTVPGAIEAFRYSYPLRLLWTPAMVWRVYGVAMPLGLSRRLV